MPEYITEPDVAYNWMTAVYFFLGGLSAGAFLFSVVANYWKKDLRPLGKTVGILAPIVLAVGMLFLLLHLGRPERAWRLFLSFNPRSALSWGVWFLNIFFALSLLYAWSLVKGSVGAARKFGYLGAPFAIAVASYTGVLLTQAPGRPLWHSPLLPVLFLNGAVISGTALAVLVSAGRQNKTLLAKVGKFLAGLVALELGMLFVEFVVLFNGGADGAAAARALLTGQYATLFLGIEVFLGSIIPIFLLLRRDVSASAQAVASILILIGIIAMRYVVVVGGQVIS